MNRSEELKSYLQTSKFLDRDEDTLRFESYLDNEALDTRMEELQEFEDVDVRIAKNLAQLLLDNELQNLHGRTSTVIVLHSKNDSIESVTLELDGLITHLWEHGRRLYVLQPVL